MRLAIYCLIGAMLGGLGIGLASSTSLDGGSRNRSRPHWRAYVDIDRLVDLHPAWTTLDTMKSTVTAARDIPTVRSGKPAETQSDTPSGRQGLRPSGRKELVEEAMNRADESLSALEAMERDALKARIAARRATMMRNAVEELKARECEIEQAAASEMKSVGESDFGERLNAQLKLKALQGMVQVPGVDKAGAGLRLKDAEASVARINQTRAAREQEIGDEAQSRIEEMRQGINAQIDASLMIYESGQTRRIDDRMAAARREMSGPMEVRSWRLEVGNSTNRPVIPRIRERDKSGCWPDWSSRIAAIESRIRADLRRSVKEMARARGIEVTFSRAGSDAPDRTDFFRGLMRNRAWTSCGPVLCGAGGS